MAALTEWKVPPSAQPRAEDYGYDLERALSSVVGLHSIIPPDAFTAETLGVERAGNGVLIDNGLVLTIGYLITEAATVWLHLGDGRVVGRPRARLRPGNRLRPGAGAGQARSAGAADRLVGGGRDRRAGRDRRRRRAHAFARRAASPPSRNSPAIGNTCSTRRSSPCPAHPNWGGTGLISRKGELIGIGSLQLERARERQERAPQHGGADRSADSRSSTTCANSAASTSRRGPGSALYSTEIEDKIVVVGIAPKGPAARAELKTGDVILAVKGENVSTLAALLPQGLGARPSRRRSAADALSRGRHLRCAGKFIRPRQVPQAPRMH